ncbi:7091_t:CDS:2, partial [Cetraspora pellucida]
IMSEHIEENIYPTTLLTIKIYGDIYYSTQTTEGVVKFFEDLDRSCIDGQKWAYTAKTTCNYATTLRSNTWLARSNSSLDQIAKIMFCWSHKLPQKFAVVETNVSAHIMVD